MLGRHDLKIRHLLAVGNVLLALTAARMCADERELVILHQGAFAADFRTRNTFFLGWQSSTQVCVGGKYA